MLKVPSVQFIWQRYPSDSQQLTCSRYIMPHLPFPLFKEILLHKLFSLLHLVESYGEISCGIRLYFLLNSKYLSLKCIETENELIYKGTDLFKDQAAVFLHVSEIQFCSFFLEHTVSIFALGFVYCLVVCYSPSFLLYFSRQQLQVRQQTIYTCPNSLYLFFTHIYNQQSMQALVFDHHSELTPLFFPSAPHSIQFPSVPEFKGRSARGVQSYSIVLQQSLVTVDRGLLKEILSSGTGEVIENSVKGLPPKCVSPLLIALQELINQDPKSTRALCNWISELVRIHLAIITSNPQNCAIVQRIRKYIAKRTVHRQSLTEVFSKCKGASESYRIEYKPKFAYKQEVQQPQKEQQPMEAEDLSQFEDDIEFE